MLAKLLVTNYKFLHGKCHLPGGGWLIRKFLPLVPSLKAYPLKIEDVGTAVLDFSDMAAFGMLNYVLEDYDNDGPLLRYLGKCLKPGNVFWDVGANIGYLTMYFARPSHKLSAIHAFEPNPRAYAQLASLFRNHPVVKTHPVGLGESSIKSKLNVSDFGSQLGSLSREVESGKQIQIEVRNGDDYLNEQGLPMPDVIKIDVEGFEVSVLAGLSKTIRQKRPIIFLEHIWLSDEQLNQLIPPKYTIQIIFDSGELTSDLTQRMKGANAVLVPEEQAGILEE